ncbi:AMIN domain-containing protein [Thermodesulfobium acidiphilum]|uniref:AMIN domain-containing protein n=1 Tax=Thermodesulfobium acidiphilum TaxID=1794699 RepID=A0A2R4W0C4_THEAF|nr:AMIN domain-containing protein [Thermodesulfobium acidiphilum]AWB10253.1 AMIN domain-containing protein [Thermodesulfobium acidiphilum]
MDVAYADILSNVQNISYKATENGVEVFVYVHGNPNFNYFRLPDGRIVLDIDNSIISKKNNIITKSPIAREIRFAQNTPNKVRVVIESDKNYPYIVSKRADGLEVNIGNFKMPSNSSENVDNNSSVHDYLNNSTSFQDIRRNFIERQPEIIGNTDVNNPGNLRSKYGGFNSYKDINSGIYAAYYNIIRKPGFYNGGNESIKNIIYTWAPPSENNSSRYLDDVIKYCNRFGLNINPDTNFASLSLEQQEIVLCAMFNKEGNRDWINITRNLSEQQKIALINNSILEYSSLNYIASNSGGSQHLVSNPTTQTSKIKESSQGIDKILGKTIVGILRAIF